MLPARKEKRVTSNEGELPKTESQKIFQMMNRGILEKQKKAT